MRKVFLYLSIISMLLNINLSIYASAKIKDSIPSQNILDDGITIGFDETQNQKTKYSDSITIDAIETTNVYVSQASSFGVFIPKTIVLSGQDKNANYLVNVNGNIGGEDIVNVVPEETFVLSQFGKNDIVAKVLQDKVSWKYNELDIDGNGSIIANDMTAGKWNGCFNFDIFINNNSLIKVIAKDKDGNNLNARANEIIEQEKEILINSLVENNFISSTKEINAIINVESNDFDDFANVTFDVNSIAQEGDKIAILHFDETKQEWEYISTEIVDENGEISTNLESFSPIAFIKVDEFGNIIENIPNYSIKSFNDLSWSEISTLAQRNEFLNYYEIGETKSFIYNGKTYNAEVIGVNTYNNGEITFMTKELLPTKYAMNSTNTNTGGWPNSALRKTLNTTIYNNLPKDLKEIIIPKTLNYETSSGSVDNITMISSTDNLWLPTQYEILGNWINEQDTGYYKSIQEILSNNQKIYEKYKTLFGYYDSSFNKSLNGTNNIWWLSSPNLSRKDAYHDIRPTNETPNDSTSSTLRGVPLAFIIG